MFFIVASFAGDDKKLKVKYLMRNPQADFEAEKHEEEYKKTIYPKIIIP